MELLVAYVDPRRESAISIQSHERQTIDVSIGNATMNPTPANSWAPLHIYGPLGVDRGTLAAVVFWWGCELTEVQTLDYLPYYSGYVTVCE